MPYSALPDHDSLLVSRTVRDAMFSKELSFYWLIFVGLSKQINRNYRVFIFTCYTVEILHEES